MIAQPGMLVDSIGFALRETWWPWMLDATLQFAVLFLIVAIADRLLRQRLSPTMRLALWSLPLLKLLLPPFLATPISITAIGLAPLYEPWHQMIASTPAAVVSGCAVVWLAGVIVFGVKFIQRQKDIRRALLDSKQIVASPAWLDVMHMEVADRITIRRPVALRVVDHIASPVVIGVRRPCVLIPQTMIEKVGRDDLRTILAHELLHIKRGDLAYQSLVAVLQVVFWFNPLCHFLRRRTMLLQEVCCDGETLARLNSTPPDYARTLRKVARLVIDPPPAPALAYVRPGEHLKRRITELQRHHGHLRPHHGIHVAAVMVLMKVFVFPMGSI